jgi:hypothetical protein
MSCSRPRPITDARTGLERDSARIPIVATLLGTRRRVSERPVRLSAMAIAWLRERGSGPPNSTSPGGSGSVATVATRAATSAVETQRRGAWPPPKTATRPRCRSNRPMAVRWISWKASGRTIVARMGESCSRASIASFARSMG